MARAYKVYGGLGSGVQIKDEISPLLRGMAATAPLAFATAAHRVGYRVQKEIKAGISAGVIGGWRIPPRKTLNRKGRGYLKEAWPKFKNKHRLRPNYHLRNKKRFTGGGWKGIETSNRSESRQSLQNAIGFEPLVNGAMVGWLSRTAPMWGRAVQEARRGGRPRTTGGSLPMTFSFRRTQEVKPRQRRYFAALGLYVKKHKIMEQKSFDLFEAYVPTMRKWINPFMTRWIMYYLFHPKGKAYLRRKVTIVPYSVVKAPRNDPGMYADRKWYAQA